MLLEHFHKFFPEIKESDEVIEVQLCLGEHFVDKNLWRDTWIYGVCLFAAHNVALAARASSPGEVTGIVTSKSVGPVSKGIDTGAATFNDAGFWNATTYGQKYFYFLQIFGATGTQL